MQIDYSQIFYMYSDALESGKIWFANLVLQTFIKYPILAVPFIIAIIVNSKKAVVKLVKALT